MAAADGRAQIEEWLNDAKLMVDGTTRLYSGGYLTRESGLYRYLEPLHLCRAPGLDPEDRPEWATAS